MCGIKININKLLISTMMFLCSLGLVFLDISLAADPLIKAHNLVYLGAIKTPAGTFGNSSLDYGGNIITFNPTNSSLFIRSHPYQNSVGEISLPAPVYNTNLLGPMPVNSAVLTNLNTAKFIQNFTDISEGNLNKIKTGGTATDGVHMGGLLKYGSSLIGTVFRFFDTDSETTVFSHFKSGTNLSATGDYGGMYSVGVKPNPVPNTGFVAGFMSLVPDNSGIGGTNWQTRLGGPALTGQGSLSIISRTSFGPAAFAFDPARLGIDNPVTATPLLYYSQAHPTLGSDGVVGATNPPYGYNSDTKFGGMIMIPGTQTILYVGKQGIGPYYYGIGTNDPDAVTPGSVYYDPVVPAHGSHSYPYTYQIWAYDAADLADARTGTYTVTNEDFAAGRFITGRSPNNTVLAVGQTVSPWNVKPYTSWTLPFAWAYTQSYGGGVAYDPSSQTLYISASESLKEGCCSVLPLIHAFHVDLKASPAASYKIGGKAFLLNGSVTIKNNGGDNLVITATDSTALQNFQFITPIAAGSTYEVTIAQQPTNQTCTVHSGAGKVIANADIANIVLTCSNQKLPKAPVNLKKM